MNNMKRRRRKKLRWKQLIIWTKKCVQDYIHTQTWNKSLLESCFSWYFQLYGDIWRAFLFFKSGKLSYICDILSNWNTNRISIRISHSLYRRLVIACVSRRHIKRFYQFVSKSQVGAVVIYVPGLVFKLISTFNVFDSQGISKIVLGGGKSHSILVSLVYHYLIFIIWI